MLILLFGIPFSAVFILKLYWFIVTLSISDNIFLFSPYFFQLMILHATFLLTIFNQNDLFRLTINYNSAQNPSFFFTINVMYNHVI